MITNTDVGNISRFEPWPVNVNKIKLKWIGHVA